MRVSSTRAACICRLSCQGNDDQVAMGGASRIWTFLPTFIGIALLLIGGYGMVSALAPQIEAQQVCSSRLTALAPH